MESTTDKHLQSTLLFLLALATAGALAEPCDFEFVQSVNGDRSRIQVGDIIAVIQKGTANGTWKGFVKHGNNITTSDNTGSSNTSSEIPIIDRGSIENLIAERLDGIKVSIQQGGKLFIHLNGNNVRVESAEMAYRILKANRNVALYADLYDARFNYFQLLYLDDIAFVLIDGTCDNIDIVPLNMVHPEIQRYVERRMCNVQELE